MSTQEIIQGDCLEVMRKFPDETFDLCLTSPPYDNLRDYNGYSFDFESTAKEIYRVLKEGAVCVWVVGDQTVDGSETGTSFRQALFFKEIGMNLHDTMIYQRDTLPLTHKRYEQHFEYMFVLSKGRPKTFNGIEEKSIYAGQSHQIGYTSASTKDKGKLANKAGKKAVCKDMKLKSNIWKYAVGLGGTTNDKSAFIHPAMFPEKLAADHIVSWTDEGDLVLDPFNGSGTTTKMAKQLGRQFVGIDISQEYCEIARKRIEQESLF